MNTNRPEQRQQPAAWNGIPTHRLFDGGVIHACRSDAIPTPFWGPEAKIIPLLLLLFSMMTWRPRVVPWGEIVLCCPLTYHHLWDCKGGFPLFKSHNWWLSFDFGFSCFSYYSIMLYWFFSFILFLVKCNKRSEKSDSFVPFFLSFFSLSLSTSSTLFTLLFSHSAWILEP